jgi:hypothetical protein
MEHEPRFDFTVFDRYVEEHGIPEEDSPDKPTSAPPRTSTPT